MQQSQRVAIIGAGMAGLSCGQRLLEGGRDVVLFEKSRGTGGRIATRRMDGYQFDHGAQYVTARTVPFRTYLAQAIETGASSHWRPHQAGESNQSKEWFVGEPGMSHMVRPLAAGLSIQHNVRITTIEKADEGLKLLAENGDVFGPFGHVAVTAPAPQAHALLASHDPVFGALANVTFAPCWAGLFAFEQRIGVQEDVIRNANGIIAWAARDSAKPGRSHQPECWVVHASPEWSREHIEADKDEIAPVLSDAFKQTVDLKSSVQTVSVSAHRWRYAMVESPIGQQYVLSKDGRLGAAGDWCMGPRVEAAYESGRALAESLLEAEGAL